MKEEVGKNTFRDRFHLEIFFVIFAETNSDESPTRVPILETAAVQDETIQIVPPNQITTEALTGHTSTPVTTVARRQRQRRNFPAQRQSVRERNRQLIFLSRNDSNLGLLFLNVPAINRFSQVVMAVAKFPDEATLQKLRCSAAMDVPPFEPSDPQSIFAKRSANCF